MCVQIRSRNQRSCETTTAQPAKFSKPSSNARKVFTSMAERGIACNVHYKPLPLLSAYKNMGFDIKDYPNAYDMFHNALTLPLHTRLSDEDVQYVIDNLTDILKNG